MAEHVPVLAQEVLDYFKTQSLSPKLILEGTFGRGGHTKLLLSLNKVTVVCAFDRDEEAIKFAHNNMKNEIESGRLKLVHDTFENFRNYGLGPLDGGLLDLGVSSPQITRADRGFSFTNDGPLDMRMDLRQKLTAAEIINHWDEKDLQQLFKTFGEVKSPFRVVRAIVHDRKTKPYTTTRELASLIERVEGWRKKGSHPATNYFMALRIVVNEELTGLSEVLSEIIQDLNPQGRLAVISFHSLEDRIVKATFKKMSPSFGKILTKKVVIPSDEEVAANPRARSAKMRVFEKSIQTQEESYA